MSEEREQRGKRSMSTPQSPDRRPFLLSRAGLALMGFLAAAGYLLWREHQAHVAAALPWLLIGGCLAMHFFMHRGHGGDGEPPAGGRK